MFFVQSLLPIASWADADKKVCIISIRGDIMPPVLYVVRRGIKEAVNEEVDLVVLDMETDGGRLDTTEELIAILDRFEGRKVTFVNKKAFSAGAFISVATEEIYMVPGSVIGAAAPIMLSPGGTGIEAMPNTMEVKITSGISALVRANAERYGHNTAVIEAMIDKSKELRIGDEVLCEKGQILTLTNTEAARSYDPSGKPLLSAGTVENEDALLELLEFANAKIIRIEPTGTEQFGAWINKISPILLMIGLIGLYIEFKTPGFGLPGIIGLAAFIIYFLGGHIAGLSSIGWGAVFIIGLLLLVVELLLIPGTFLTGVIGIAMMLVAIVMAFVDWNPALPAYTAPSLGEFTNPLQSLTFALFGALCAIVLLSRFLPETTIYRRMLSASISGGKTESRIHGEHDRRLGQTGIVVTALRPGGKARLGEEVIDVVSQGEMIDAGTEVKVIGFSGSDAIVVST